MATKNPDVARASLEHLTRDVTPETELVEIAGGLEVLVRQISRAEYLHASKAFDGDTGKIDVIRFERRILAAGLVDPPMSEHNIAAWQKQPGSGPDVQKVLDKIMTWSGFRQDAAKSGV